MPIQIHGKEYRTVAERVNQIHTDHPKRVEIETQIIEHYRPEGKPAEVTIKATITIVHPTPAEWEAPYRLIRIPYTGHAHEVQDLSVPKKGEWPKVNATSYLENAETSAVGRALAAAGYSGEEYASANEMNTALRRELEMEIDDLKGRLRKGIEMYKEVVKSLEGYQIAGPPGKESGPQGTSEGDPYKRFDGDPQPGEE